MNGMAAVLNEASEIPIDYPPGFPICSSFHNDPSRDTSFNTTLIVSITLGVAILVEAIIISVCLAKLRAASEEVQNDRKPAVVCNLNAENCQAVTLAG